MRKFLKIYIDNRTRIQTFIPEKMFEGVMASLQDEVVHLIGEKYEYYLPMESILSIKIKLTKEKRSSIVDKNNRVGFK